MRKRLNDEPATLLLKRSEVESLLSFGECIDAVEQAFSLHAEGKALKSGLLHIDSVDGEFHIKAGGLESAKRYFAVKVNGGFFQNSERFRMPNIQGAILLCDGENGYPLAIMDSREITRTRTGAATAVAAKYLARPDSTTLTICGCGTQGRIQIRSVALVLPIQKVFAWSRDQDRATSFAREVSRELQLDIRATEDLRAALRQSDVCVTCTPSRRFFLKKAEVPKGMFVAAVGADSPDKQELDPALLCANTVVVDLLEQCAHVGELHHALECGMKKKKVHAELGEIVLGKKRGRTSEEQTIIFDSTGTALQDVAAASVVYEKALVSRKGTSFDLFA